MQDFKKFSLTVQRLIKIALTGLYILHSGMNWSIEYYSSKLEEDVLKLPPNLLARYLHLTDLMLEFGSNLGMPHTKAIESGLFELRVKGKEGIARVFVKKSQKTPKKELKIALQKMKEVQ